MRFVAVMLVGLSAACIDVVEETAIEQHGKVKPPSTTEVTYWVSAGAPTPTGKLAGSVDKPYPTIAAALAKADSVNAASVTVRVKYGRYYENVDVRRPTTIIGEGRQNVVIHGSITNLVATRLTVRDLRIETDRFNPALGTMGGIFVKTPCEVLWQETIVDCLSPAETTVTSVDILSPNHWGIRQAGGGLTINDVFIDRVQTTLERPFNQRTGVGLYLLHHATANIDNLLVRDSPQGFLLYDSNVRLWDNIDVTGCGGTAPGNPEIAAAVEVSWGVTLVSAPRVPVTEYGVWQQHVGDSLNIVDSKGIGLLVQWGATANLTHARINYTKKVGPIETGYASNVYVREATLDLAYFDASFSGVVSLSWESGSMSAYRGYVQHNPIGATICGSCSAQRIANEVLYSNNGVNIDSSVLPLPPPPPPP